ncbi:MAG: hypothetical protein GVY18_02400 [Bacteroidetes bacterium]|jgi:hypothetical protein|nr:hypothetical protein [Bacteroidota bacterium]
MDTPYHPEPLDILRHWLNGTVSHAERQDTCTVLCMDYRYGPAFDGCYNVENAGPRYTDSARSIDYMLRLKGQEAFNVLFWLTHNGMCGCSRVETYSADPEVVEPHTATTRRVEVGKLLAADSEYSLLHNAVRRGHLVVLSGHVDVTTPAHSVHFLVSETNQLLRNAGLPALPDEFQDQTHALSQISAME